MPSRRPLATRFMEKFIVADNGCWLWVAATAIAKREKAQQPPFGVIGLGVGRKTIKASRASWLIHKGEIPPSLHVLHKCDNPLCVNPDHLFLGTRQDNMDDMKSKGRSASRERHGMHKLTEFAVKEIRRSSLSNRKLAEIYGVTSSTISTVKSGHTWKGVE